MRRSRGIRDAGIRKYAPLDIALNAAGCEFRSARFILLQASKRTDATIAVTHICCGQRMAAPEYWYSCDRWTFLQTEFDNSTTREQHDQYPRWLRFSLDGIGRYTAVSGVVGRHQHGRLRDRRR